MATDNISCKDLGGTNPASDLPEEIWRYYSIDMPGKVFEILMEKWIEDAFAIKIEVIMNKYYYWDYVYFESGPVLCRFERKNV